MTILTFATRIFHILHGHGEPFGFHTLNLQGTTSKYFERFFFFLGKIHPVLGPTNRFPSVAHRYICSQVNEKVIARKLILNASIQLTVQSGTLESTCKKFNLLYNLLLVKENSFQPFSYLAKR